LAHSIADNAIHEWRKRLQACVNEKEDILNTCYRTSNVVIKLNSD